MQGKVDMHGSVKSIVIGSVSCRLSMVHTPSICRSFMFSAFVWQCKECRSTLTGHAWELTISQCVLGSLNCQSDCWMPVQLHSMMV